MKKIPSYKHSDLYLSEGQNKAITWQKKAYKKEERTEAYIFFARYKISFPMTFR
jgi:hypothetical protein